MILFTNEKGEIKDVNQTTDTSLIPLEVNDTDNPFKSWSVAKICCYNVNVSDGIVTMMTPYVDSRLIEHFDGLDTSFSNEINNTVSDEWKPRVWYVGEYCIHNNILWEVQITNSIEPHDCAEWKRKPLSEVITNLSHNGKTFIFGYVDNKFGFFEDAERTKFHAFN